MIINRIGVPWKLECTVHRESKVLSERREQQRAVVLDPVVCPCVHELSQRLLARFKWVCFLKVLVSIPLLVVAPLRRGTRYGLLRRYTEKKVDGGLLVVV